MTVVAAFGDPPPAAAIDAAVQALGAGSVVAVPTDTVYGLAADPFGTGATERIFSIKQRSRDLELPVLVAEPKDAVDLAEAVPDIAHKLMERFWPGALTIVLPRRVGLGADLGSDDATIGVRCPDHPVPRALCRSVGPLATTSANISTQPTPPDAASIARLFGDSVPVVLDAGRCEGSPSTVVDCTGFDVKLLREGRVPWAMILAFSRS